MNPITEEEARKILAEAGNQAASPELFSATRVEGGWAFGWSDRTKPIPMGVRGVVVTDAGRVGRAKIGETAEHAIARLAS